MCFGVPLILLSEVIYLYFLIQISYHLCHFCFQPSFAGNVAPLLPRPLPASVVDSRMSEKDNDVEDQVSEEFHFDAKTQDIEGNVMPLTGEHQ